MIEQKWKCSECNAEGAVAWNPEDILPRIAEAHRKMSNGCKSEAEVVWPQWQTLDSEKIWEAMLNGDVPGDILDDVWSRYAGTGFAKFARQKGMLASAERELARIDERLRRHVNRLLDDYGR